MDSFVARLKRAKVPGSFNKYVSIDTQVLGMVVAAAANQTLSRFIEENIWKRCIGRPNCFCRLSDSCLTEWDSSTMQRF
jgi:hypothetical protein